MDEVVSNVRCDLVRHAVVLDERIEKHARRERGVDPEKRKQLQAARAELEKRKS